MNIVNLSSADILQRVVKVKKNLPKDSTEH